MSSGDGGSGGYGGAGAGPGNPSTSSSSSSTPVRGKLLNNVFRMFQSKDMGRQFWMPDSISKQCYECSLRFTTLRRRHHCRICGQIFCSHCCSEMINTRLLNEKAEAGVLRVCKYCHDFVINHHKSSPSSSSSSSHYVDESSARGMVARKINRPDGSKSPGNNNNWLFRNMMARGLASPLRVMARSGRPSLPAADPNVNVADGGVSSLRPASVASNTERRLSYIENLCENEASPSILSSSVDNFRHKMAELDESIDVSAPIWVKEILLDEETKLRLKHTDWDGSLNDLLDSTKEERLEVVKQRRTLPGSESEESEELHEDHTDSDTEKKIKMYNFREKLSDAIVRYSPSQASEPEEMNNNLEDLYDFYEDIRISTNFFEPTDEVADELPVDHSDMPSYLVDVIYDLHCNRILNQILIDEKLSLDWLPIIADLSKRIANTVTLSQYAYLYSIDSFYQSYSDEVPNGGHQQSQQQYPMDIRRRVKIKSIQNGSKSECSVINGLVFNKNVAHKQMRTLIDEPRVLLFACSIGYDERRRSVATTTSTMAILKMTMFDSMRMQESSYIANLVAKIASLQPDVIFVQGSVSQMALEQLREKQITVVLNVKKSILDRIALFTGTFLIQSPEMIMNTTKIGRCGRFRLQKFKLSSKDTEPFSAHKTLMFLEGCSETIGCSVLLRGSSSYAEFKKLKNILRFLIYVHYHCRLEKAFHLSLNCIPIESDGSWNSMAELYQHLRQQLQGKRTRSRHPTGNDDLAASPRSVVDGDLNLEKLTKLTIIDDNSDPLRAPIENEDDEVSSKKESDLSKTARIMSEKMEHLVRKLPLSCSPAIHFPVPFLLGKNIDQRSSLRFYYPTELLDSPRLKREMSKKEVERDEEVFEEPDVEADDEDYANFKYLLSETKNGAHDSKKLAALRQLLINRYMVSKEHPLMNNCDYDYRRQHQQYVADFRARGPVVRCVPNFVISNVEDTKKKPSVSEPNEPQSSSSPVKQAADPLRTQEQQDISVLFSVFSSLSENAPMYCFKPKIIDISYYGRNDMSLGAFLFRHFFFFRRSRFNQSAGSDETLDATGTNANIAVSLELSRKIICFNENCNVSMFKHTMRFTHNNGTILVLLNKLHDTRHVEMPHKIMTWTYCMQCLQRSNPVDVPTDALAMSFGKFLELKFYGERHFNCYKYFPEAGARSDEACTLCQHSMHKDSFQFFSYDQLVVSFKFEPINLYEVATPAPIIPVTKNFFSKTKLIDEVRELTVQSEDVFAQISHQIEKIKNNQPTNTGLNITLDQSDIVILDDLLQILQVEKAELTQKIKEVHYRISQPRLEESSVVELFRIQNTVVRVKKSIAESVSAWNLRINEYISSRKGKGEKLFTTLVNRFLSGEPSQDKENDSDGASIRRNDTSSSTLDNVSESTMIEEDGEPDKTTGSKLISKVISKVTNNEGAGSNFARFLAKGSEENHVNIEMPQFVSDGAAKASPMFEHYKLPTHKDISIIVRDRDPGSIIAYALTSPEYDKKLSSIRADKQNLASNVDCGDVDGKAVGDSKSPSTPNILSNKPDLLDAAKKTSPSQHIDVQFNDVYGKFYCCIYFAEQFRRFRSLVVTDGDHSNRDTIRSVTSAVSAPTKGNAGEDLYIHSLSSCIPWNALGGKSGSTFSKTKNERFILKEVSKGELRHFLTFVCDYISYCERACFEKCPSVLVKVVGVYQISYKNTVTNKGSIHYILVMENLFYECNVTIIYDLKGSMRNRKVDITMVNAKSAEVAREEEEGESGGVQPATARWQPESPTTKKSSQSKPVLLDENLRQVSALSPLYTQMHAKIFLMEAIYRDSDFLRIHGVMDYSLLVGYDEENCEYVVGIIDYVRLFNWEKVLEFRVKKIGNAIDPTIVHPSTYQKRFVEAISEYFIEVPDKWHPHLKLVPLAGSLLHESRVEPEDSALNGSQQSTPAKSKANSSVSELFTDKDDQEFL